ncbi:MAG: PIG-L deacetylase family protein [Thermoleophilaceae bacterium]
MRVAPEAPVAVLSPHLDDAVLSVWSVLAGRGPTVVVNVCSGLPDGGRASRWDRVTGASDSREQMRGRIEEDQTALALSGAEPAGLGLLDSQYRDGGLDPDAVRELALEAVPEVSALYAPAAIGGHPDHLAVRAAAFELAPRDGPPLTLYADQPYASRFGWPAWVSGEPEDLRRLPEADWEGWLEGLPADRKALAPRVERLDDESAAAKLAAMRCYESQFPALDGGGLRRMSNPYAHRFEVVWEIGG